VPVGTQGCGAKIDPGADDGQAESAKLGGMLTSNLDPAVDPRGTEGSSRSSTEPVVSIRGRVRRRASDEQTLCSVVGAMRARDRLAQGHGSAAGRRARALKQ
jgi:hypothetical protein